LQNIAGANTELRSCITNEQSFEISLFIGSLKAVIYLN